jgi:hypothetical protein
MNNMDLLEIFFVKTRFNCDVKIDGNKG